MQFYARHAVRVLHIAVWCCLTWASLPQPVALAEPSHSAEHHVREIPASARLVGADVLACAELSAVRQQWEHVQHSPFWQKWASLRLVKQLVRRPGVLQAMSANRAVAEATGVPLVEQLLSAGEVAVILAVYPSPDRSEPEGVVLLEALETSAHDRFLKTWNTIEPGGASQRVEHAGGEYFKRTKRDESGEPVFYARIGTTLVFSDREERLRQCLELAANPKKSCLATLGEYRSFRSGLRSDTAAILFIPAANWKSQIAELSSQERELAWLEDVWPFIGHLQMTVCVRDSLVIEAQLRPIVGVQSVASVLSSLSKLTDLPSAENVTSTRPVPATLTDLIHAVDPRALAVMAWSAEWPTPSRLFAEQLQTPGGREARTRLQHLLGGRDLVDDLLPQFLQRGVLQISAEAPTDSNSPIGGLFCTEYSPDKVPTVLVDTLTATAVTALTIGLLERDDQPQVTLSVSTEKSRTIRRWDQHAPVAAVSSVEPGRWLLASSDKLYTAWLERRTAASKEATGNEWLLEQLDRYELQPKLLAWVNLRELREQIRTDGPRWINWFRKPPKPAELAANLIELAGVLEAVDAALLGVDWSLQGGRIVFAVTGAPVRDAVAPVIGTPKPDTPAPVGAIETP